MYRTVRLEPIKRPGPGSIHRPRFQAQQTTSVSFGKKVASSHQYDIVRLVLDGPPKPDSAGKLLKAAFGQWPGKAKAKFLMVPGGFAEAPWPKDWKGQSGWASRPQDGDLLVQVARKQINRIMDPELRKLAQNKVDFITIGIDVCLDEGVSGPHAELIGVYDVKAGKVVGFTGKSYPLGAQEETLVQVADLHSHFMELGGDKVMILGCHDLNMFSPRAIANHKPGTERSNRSKAMRKLAEAENPVVVLQHPHATDTAKTWHIAWSGIRQAFAKLKTWASGIGYYNYNQPEKRQALQKVLEQTRSDNGKVYDIVIPTADYPSRPGLYLKN